MQKTKEQKEAERLKKLIADYNRNDGKVMVFPGVVQEVEFPFGFVRVKRMVSGTVYILQNSGQLERLNRKWYAKAEKWIKDKNDKELQKYIHRYKTDTNDTVRTEETGGDSAGSGMGITESQSSETNQP